MEHFEAVAPAGPAWTVMGSNPVSGSIMVPSNSGKYFIQNLSSSVPCFLGYGMTSGAAQTNAVNLALAGGPNQNVLVIQGPPTGARVYTLAPGQFFAGLTAGGGTAPVVIIPADGI